jgi:mono/diheme cytochrome c family protein
MPSITRCALALVALGVITQTATAQTAAASVVASAPALSGEATFKTVCVACHGATGDGIPGVAPALAGALQKQLASAQNKAYLASVLIGGLSGPIESKGLKYNSAMPKLGLQDEQVANVLNYITQALNQAPADFTITPQDVAQVRATAPQAGSTHALRKAIMAKPTP